MRALRDFRPGQIYGVTQRGNRGQWVYADAEDFAEALRLMAKYARRYGVRIHGWALMHNHGHWMFEASSEESVSNLMRDMQGCYSRYLNKKYRKRPWVLLSPFYGRLGRRSYSKYLRAGPVNWTPRFDAELLDGAGFRSFLRYIENNPVRAGLVKRAERWEWSSAEAHVAGEDLGGLLCLSVWRHLFGAPERIAEDWADYLAAPAEEARATARRSWVARAGSGYNRPTGWVAPEVGLAAVGARPG